MTDEKRAEIKKALTLVYDTLKEHGYNPIFQIMGYLVTEDPSYITTYNNARGVIKRYDRDDLMEEILTTYFG